MARKTITIQEDTYERLDDTRALGQSFDGKIRELLADEREVVA